jgi:outer membrane receptor for Fe3+-dicitrate
MEEISYQTSSLPAEAPVGGVQINMIPRAGGNDFRGTAFATGANGSMQSNNSDDEIVALGFTARNRVKSVYDVNLTYGGPIQRERLWFFATYRAWSANNYLGNTFDAQGNQAVDDQRIQDGTLRLTWQAAPQHKLAVHYDRSAKWRGHRPNNWIGASINEPVSSVEQTTQLNYIGEVKWSSPISNRLLAEFAVFTMPVNYSLKFQEDAAPDAIATFDQVRSVFMDVSPRQDINAARMFTYAGYFSFVSGAHNFKTGLQVRTGWSEENFQTRGDIVQIVSNGVPQSVRLVNTPSGHKESGTNLGIYVQDSWTLGRVTINPGIRFERFQMSIPEQRAGAGRWVPERQFAAQENIVDWKSVSPRLGFAWDLTGDGRTALKGGASRYDRLAGVNLVQPLNQRNIAFQTCPWSDTNADLRAQESEIAFARCTGSLQPSLGNVDPDLKRPYQWEFNVMVQRQLGSRTAVMAGYYGRRFWNLYTTVNDAVPPTAYSPVTITNPLTNEPMTVYNQDPTTRGAVRNVLKTLPELKHRYHGAEFQINTRLTRATFFAGLTIGANRGDQDNGDLNNPNLLINNYGAVGFDAPYQIRGGFSYRLPADVQLSGSIREQSGLPETRTYPVTTAQVPGLTQVTQNVQVAPRGEYRFPWVNIVDLRVTKTFTSGALRFEPIVDLFNIFNNNAVTNSVQTVGSSLGRPSAIVMGRLLRLGARMNF